MNWESKYGQDFQEEVEKNGLRNPNSTAKFFKSKMDGWKEVQVDIAITGDSGAGKSSFINTIRGHILACLHFNENLRRETQVSKDGKPYMHVTYPKFKLGEEVVREVACPPSYDYVDTMKKLLFSLTNAERKEVLEKYLSKQPEPLNRQFLERKSKEEAVKDYRARQQMRKTSLVPSGAEQSSLQSSSQHSQTRSKSSTRKPLTCSVCKKPMCGHKGRCKT